MYIDVFFSVFAVTLNQKKNISQNNLTVAYQNSCDLRIVENLRKFAFFHLKQERFAI